MYLSLLDLMRQRGPLAGGGESTVLEPRWEENATHLILRFSLPGIDPKTVHVQVAETSIAIAGSRSQEERVETEGYLRFSASVGSMVRSFRLPSRVVPRLTQVTWSAPQELVVQLAKA